MIVIGRRAWTTALLVVVTLLVLAAPAARAQEWPRSNWPAPLPSRRVPFPPYELTTLVNGLPVVGGLTHSLPFVGNAHGGIGSVGGILRNRR